MIYVIIDHVTIFELCLRNRLNWLILMDRFLKRPAVGSPSGSLTSSSKRRSVAAKQSNVTALVRVAEFGKDTFYADAGRLFCRPCNLVVDHIRKHTVEKHTKKHLYRKITAFLLIFAATKPRFLKFLPRQDRDFWNFCRDKTAILCFLACRGAAIFGKFYRDKQRALARHAES